MGKKKKEGATKSEDILNYFSNKEVPKEPMFDDPTCVDGAVPDEDDDDDDDNIDLDWLLQAPTLEVIQEIITCKGQKPHLSIVVQYEKQSDDAFEYEFSIEEIDS